MKSDPPPVCPLSIPVSESTHFRVINHERSSEQCGPCSEMSAHGLIMTEEPADETVVTVGMELQMETAETQKAAGAAAHMMCDVEETMSCPPGKTDSPSKRKGAISLDNTILFLWGGVCLSSQPPFNLLSS